MIRKTSTALLLLLALIACPPSVLADECDDVGTLKEPHLKRCKSTLSRNCANSRGSSKDRCVKTTIANALKSQERADKKIRDAESLQAAWGFCISDEYEKACAELSRGRSHICQVAHSEPRISDAVNDPIENDVKMWLERYQAYPRLKEDIRSFVERFGKCEEAPRDYQPQCKFRDYEQKECASAEQKFKDNWSAYIQYFEERALADQQRALDRLKQSKAAPTASANHYLDSPPRIIEAIKQINEQVPWLGGSSSKIAEIQSKLLKNQSEARATLEKLLLKIKCPVKGRSGKYYNILLAHNRATKNPNSTLQEEVKRFAVTGKARQEREPLKRITHQILPATSCVKQVRESKETCRIFDMSFRRSKPDGGKWGAWGFYSVGGGGLMSCKNLR